MLLLTDTLYLNISESFQFKTSDRLGGDIVYYGCRVPVICSSTLPVFVHAIDVSSIYLQKLHWVKIHNRAILTFTLLKTSNIISPALRR